MERDDKSTTAWPRMESDPPADPTQNDRRRYEESVILSEQELHLAIDLALMQTQSVWDLNRCLKERSNTGDMIKYY